MRRNLIQHEGENFMGKFNSNYSDFLPLGHNAITQNLKPPQQQQQAAQRSSFVKTSS